MAQIFSNQCSEARVQIKQVGQFVKELIEQAKLHDEIKEKGEMIANVTLAYRHMEDAAMRLGKAIQAYEGGESIYDSNDAARVAGNGPVAAGTYSSEK